MAQIHGKSIKFEDGRMVFLAKLPDGYGMRFTNAEGQHTALALSAEAMQALVDLYMAGLNDTPTIWKQFNDVFEAAVGTLEKAVGKKP